MHQGERKFPFPHQIASSPYAIEVVTYIGPYGLQYFLNGPRQCLHITAECLKLPATPLVVVVVPPPVCTAQQDLTIVSAARVLVTDWPIRTAANRAAFPSGGGQLPARESNPKTSITVHIKTAKTYMPNPAWETPDLQSQKN